MEISIISAFILILIPLILQIVLGNRLVKRNDQKKFELLIVVTIIANIVFAGVTPYILPTCGINLPNFDPDCLQWFALIPPSIMIFMLLLATILFQTYRFNKRKHL